MNALSHVASDSLPNGNEVAVAYCFVCKQRWAKQSMRAATMAWNRHRKTTGHAIGSIMTSIQKQARRSK